MFYTGIALGFVFGVAGSLGFAIAIALWMEWWDRMCARRSPDVSEPHLREMNAGDPMTRRWMEQK